MKGLYIEQIGLNDFEKVETVSVTMVQARFVSPPADAMTLISELGSEDRSLPFRITLGGETIGFFTLNFFCPIQSQADEGYYGGESDCRIESFMIDQSFQRQGFGLHALREVFSLLKREFPHINAVNLSVNFLNEEAKNFYLKCGFSDSGKVFHGGSEGPQHIYSFELAKGTEILL